ncbi:type II toxin-antitoxin system RelE/ParE family toxin [Candidatus Poriferisodalis sp.]|uniref:type II toxin-antitoxin system RelE/ParE family toxin n=1 Tax=Candidatus Poriferisodalis sp. TaxID=3101277 RepID=UPI003B02395E
MAKPVELRHVASQDIDDAVAYYVAEADNEVATGFIADLREALSHLADHPLSGSLRWSYELEIPELRHWPLQRFPYIVFYVDRDSAVDVWRVLHARRDIPAWLTPSG